MKKSRAETAKTRQRIVEVASEVIRKQGIDATGVAEIMAAAGLTHGGFYRHFESKEKLVTEAIAFNRKNFLGGTVEAAKYGADALRKHFQDYVTPDSRDDVGGGCPLAANGSEIVRGDATTRHNVTEAFRLWFGNAAPFMRARDDDGKDEMAMNLVANMIGALTMSRMVDDPALSDRILAAAERRIAEAFAAGAAGAEPPAPKAVAKASAGKRSAAKRKAGAA